MARASLIRKGLADPTGTSSAPDSASNQFRKLGGGMENFSVAIGTGALPAIQSGHRGAERAGRHRDRDVREQQGAIEGFGRTWRRASRSSAR
jgi:hypothetical protein